MIQELDQQAAMALWPDVKGYVAVALARDPTNDVSLEDVEKQLAKNFAVMLVATDQEGEVQGVIVVQLFVLRGQRVLHVLTAGGDSLDEWLADLIGYLRDMAQRQEAAGVTMAGRPGWVKKLTQFGFKSEHVIMRMEVENGGLRKEREQPPKSADVRELRGPGAGAVSREPSERSADTSV